MAPRKRTAAELKTFRAEKRRERLAMIDRAIALRTEGLLLVEIAREVKAPLSTVAQWLAIRAVGERAVLEAQDRERARMAS